MCRRDEGVNLPKVWESIKDCLHFLRLSTKAQVFGIGKDRSRL